MTRAEFMTALERSLTGLSQQERSEILADYEEHFHAGLARGRTEEDVAQSLGQPEELAKALRAEYLVRHAEAATTLPARSRGLVRAVFAFLGLSTFNLLVMVWVFFVAAVLLFALACVAVAPLFVGGAFVLSAGGLFPVYVDGITLAGPLVQAAALTSGVACLSLGVLACIGVGLLARLAAKVTLRYIRLNVEILSTQRSQA